VRRGPHFIGGLERILMMIFGGEEMMIFLNALSGITQMIRI
jgi:hypothetical protein